MKANNTNYLKDLTDAQVIEIKEAWEGVNNGQYHQWTHTRADGWDAFDVARAYPEWCFADNPQRMLNTYPHWVAINQPAFAFEREPKWVAVDNNRWVKENRPEYYAEYRKAQRLAGYVPHNGMGIEEY
jgi:hypothetical protein